MRFHEIISESLSDWSGEWVHYSKTPMMSINPNPFHHDPLGIYFFPKEFETKGGWSEEYPYKFSAKIDPSAKILDLSNISQEYLEKILQKASPEVFNDYENYVEQYPPKNMHKRVDMAWEMLSAYYTYKSGMGKILASFNKLFREMGYDAIFDDTGSIHSYEVQLLVLNPRIIKLIGMETKSGSGFNEVTMLVDMIVDECKKYGEVSASQPKKINYNDWGKIISTIKSTVKVENKDKIATFTISTDDKNPPKSIYIEIKPSSKFSRMVTYNISKKSFDEYNNFSAIQNHLKEIFSDSNESSPT